MARSDRDVTYMVEVGDSSVLNDNDLEWRCCTAGRSPLSTSLGLRHIQLSFVMQYQTYVVLYTGDRACVARLHTAHKMIALQMGKNK